MSLLWTGRDREPDDLNDAGMFLVTIGACALAWALLYWCQR